MAELAILVVLAADECDASPALAFAEKVAEKFDRFLSAPVFNATVLWYVDTLEVYRFSEVERRESLVRDFSSTRFIHDAESITMEIPSEILWFVDVETKNVVRVKLSHNDVSCLALATSEDEDHDE